MANIHDVVKEDDVNGNIVGDVMLIGALFYGDKKASYKSFYATTQDELESMANSLKQSMLDENKEIKSFLWPDDTLWNLRIY
jgi:hypothetical protein